jgi:acetoin utilization deacetylase AcuC-like enzyme
MARTGLIQNERFQEHLTGPGHPERPERLVAIASALNERGIERQCAPIEPAPIDMELVRRIHHDDYIERLRRACAQGRPFIDVADSAICPDSFEIAQLAAGGAIRAIDEVMDGHIDNAFCAIRPPGHHAERQLSLGFCLFNNIAIAAQYLIDHHNLSRILILDWDVHHGKGTQHTFEEDPRVLFISLHGHPAIVYPGTGYAHERGRGPGDGFTINLPMLPPSSDQQWQAAFDDPILPAVDRFKPEFVLISAGFDAHVRDPLAPLELTTDVFGWMTDQLIDAARRHCSSRIVSLLEGGYDLEALADCVSLHITRLLEA